jgi:hypothetical protein
MQGVLSNLAQSRLGRKQIDAAEIFSTGDWSYHFEHGASLYITFTS